MPEITLIETMPYDVPLSSGLSWGKGHHLAALQHVLIRVVLSDGAEGIAEATPRPTIYGETQTSVQTIVEQHFTPMLTGETITDKTDIDLLDQRLQLIKNNHTAKGALNMALHSALAQSEGQSLREWLGVTNNSVQVSYIVGTGDEKVVIEDVCRAYAAGVRVFKMKIGKDLDVETHTIEQLQEQFADAQFYADANQCLMIDSAASHLNALYEIGVLWCEEPLPVHLLRERQALRQVISMPIIADDSSFTFADVEREIRFGTFDILNIKTARTGFSQSAAMLATAKHAQKRVMIGSQASSLLGCIHAAIFAGLDGVDCASECTFFLKTQETLSLPIVDGYLDLNDAENLLQGFSHLRASQ